MIASPLCPGFCPMAELKNWPFVGTCAIGLQSLFLNRGGSQDERNTAVEQIKDRSDAIEVRQEAWQPFCIYPEGTTTNGDYLFPFRRGAFSSMRTVQPTYIKIKGGDVHLTYSMIDILVLFLLLSSELSVRKATLYIMPPFKPNEAMLTKHADKGKEDWQIYAWCVRDAIAKAGGFKKAEFPSYKERTDYCDFMNGRKDSILVDGQEIRYEMQSSNSKKLD